ncbi:MAG: ParA family protein [Bacteroidales bacterium]|nr:ParA family protein [Bacteroidales bacterium]
MTKIISFLNHKGGVAKTTTCANLATALWILGKKVLVIDTDQQCNLSGVLGFSQKEGDPTLSDWLKEPVPAPVYIRYEGLDYIPASKALRNMEAELLNKRSRETILARKLDQVKNEYDYVVIDCAPGDSVLNDNALSASDAVIIPTECSGFSLQGMQNLLLAIHEIQSEINPNLSIEGYLLVKYDKQTKIAKEVSRYFEKQSEVPTMKTKIRKCVKFDESPLGHQTIFEYAPESNGAEDYMRLAEEMTGAKRPKNWKTVARKAEEEMEESNSENGN